MIRAGQIYKQKNKPAWREWESDIFVVTFVGFQAYTISCDGITSLAGLDWIKGDCELIAEYDTWQTAVNSKEFKNG